MEKKIIEAEIIKALECCKMPVGSKGCKQCPLRTVRDMRLTEGDPSCTTIMLELALDLINDQKAEIERLIQETRVRRLPENGVIVGGEGDGVPGAARPTDMGVSLYLEFRAELDKIRVPAIVRTLDFIEHIKYEGQIVGFIGGNSGYIDSLYVMPRHRRKGLAKRAVLDWYRKYARPYENVRLHIITDNAPAQAFWRSVFELHKIGGDEVDELYEIIREKEGE